MKRAILAILMMAVFLLLLSSCRREAAPQESRKAIEGKYRIEFEEKAEKDTLLMCRMLVTAEGERKFAIDGESILVQPDQKGLTEAHIVMVADLFAPPTAEVESRLRWSVELSGGGTGATKSSLLTVGSTKKINEVVTFHLKPGEYTLGKAIDFATIQNEKISLTVE